MGDDTIAVCDQKESIICTGWRRNWWSCWLLMEGMQGRIQVFVLGGAYRDGNGGVPLQTCQGVWESAESTIIPAPKP